MEEHCMQMKRLAALAVVGAVVVGTMGYGALAKANEPSSDYTITIPATLEVKNSGWNNAGGITAKVKDGDVFDSTKKLTVSASSANNDAGKGWSLVSGENKVGYNLATETGTYNSEATPASWEFSASDLNAANGTNKGMGIIVENYDEKPAGNYTDTVTFTAKVENAVTAPTLAGVTLTDGMIIEPHCTVGGGDNWVQFKYVADDNKFVPNFNSYNDMYSKSDGPIMQQLADQWAYSTFEYHETPNGNFYLTQTGNTVHLRADDGINMNVIDLQLDFDNMTYTQLYKQWYNTVSGSFTSIKIGDTTITASQMTAQ